MHVPSSLRTGSLLAPLAALALLLGCGGASRQEVTALDPDRTNLVFVVSEDLTYNARGDVNPDTAGLTSQGLQRTLAMGTFLRQEVLGGRDADAIHALEPMTHLQTAHRYPDMNALMAVQPFALLNRITLSSDLAGGTPFTGQNRPVNASYSPGAVPPEAAAPTAFAAACQGLDFNNTGGDNEALVNAVLAAGRPGTWVFSAPWATVRSLLASLAPRYADQALPPTSYAGPNVIYVVSATRGEASLVTYDSRVHPSSSYPVLSSPAFGQAPAPNPTPASLTVTGGVAGAQVPAGINTGQTLYLVRHAEAHPQGYWSDSNYVGAGQWRALQLPVALQGRAEPDQVWSQDPSQWNVGTVSSTGQYQYSNLAPALTVQPFAIARGLPCQLVAGIDAGASDAPRRLAEFFFTGGTFSGQKLLVGWNFQQTSRIVDALLASYFPNGGAPAAPQWSPADYDSMWVLTLDGQGNLSVDFSQYEGILSSALPVAPPVF